MHTLKRAVVLLLAVSLLGGIAAVPTGGEGDELSFTVSVGTLEASGAPADLHEASTDVQQNMSGHSGAVSARSSTGIPCELFDIDVPGTASGNISVCFDGKTLPNERFALKARNVRTGEWDTLGSRVSDGEISASLPAAEYAENGKVQVMALPDYVTNGSSRVIWSTDQQHYAKFADLHAVYEGIHRYMADEYQAGNIAYVVNTGDIVDDRPDSSAAKGEWVTASRAFEILDDAGVPYGIVTGNHDTDDYPGMNYTDYLAYFSEERYADKPWYGGTEDDNRSHYDLVTAGNVDLLFLYIGYGLENDEETLSWANEVLSMYPHRNAVVCTHQYLSSRTSDWAPTARGQALFEELIARHGNVMMVWCGHDDGATRVTRNTAGELVEHGGSAEGHVVHEVLSDYQFVQVEDDSYYQGAKDPTHAIGSVEHCNGEGYLRAVDFTDGTVTMDTFSPVTGGTRPFGIRDHFTLDVDFLAPNREITAFSFTARLTGSAAAPARPAGEPAEILTGKQALSDWIQRAQSVNPQDVTKESYRALKEAVKAARSAKETDWYDAHRSLSDAMAHLVLKENEPLRREQLQEVTTFRLDTASWQNREGKRDLTAKASYVSPTVGEDGSLMLERSRRSPSKYPQVIYTEEVTVTPRDEKLYFYLDVSSHTNWSIFPTVTQDGQTYEGRWNYALEGAKDKTGDAGAGTYRGVYDVTGALLDLGVDMTRPFTVRLAINVSPGPVILQEITLLTGFPSSSASGVWLWVLFGAVLLMALIAVAAALLLRKKRRAAGKADAPKMPGDPQGPQGNTQGPPKPE